MESKKSSRIKFSRLCLSQNRLNNDGNPSSNPINNSQISKFFGLPKGLITSNNHNDTQPTHEITINECNVGNIIDKDVATTTDSIPEVNTKATKLYERVTTRKAAKLKNDNNVTDTKNTIKKFFAGDNNESLSEFEIPKKIPKFKNSVKATIPRKSKTIRTRTKQPDIRKVINNQNLESDEDAQLELALAISKADTNETSDKSSISKLIAQFEFNPNNGGSNLVFFDVNNKGTKKQHKWKSKCTQLTRRNPETQSLKIREKVDELLLNNILIESQKTPKTNANDSIDIYEIKSQLLQRFCMPEQILFNVNGNGERAHQCIHLYYTNNLVEASTVEAGVLLRDWSKIPGRDCVFDGMQLSENIHEGEDSNENNKNNNNNDGERENEPDFMETNFVNDIIEERNEVKSQRNASISSLEISSTYEQKELTNLDTNSSKNDNDEDQSSCKAVINFPIQSDNDDAEKTILMDTCDIESRLNLINSQIRLSQNFVELLATNTTTFDSDSTQLIDRIVFNRGPSPDLFGDDDEDYDCDIEPSVNNENIAINDECAETDKSKSPTLSNVIVISSNEDQIHSNGIEPKIEQNNASNSFINEDANNDKENDSLIEISDDSIHYERSDSNIVEKQRNSKSANASIEKNRSLNNSLSFTERLELFENDVLNEFKLDIHTNDLKSESQELKQDLSQLSQNSIVLSDDEINYSMNYPHHKLFQTSESNSQPNQIMLSPKNQLSPNYDYIEPIEFHDDEFVINNFDFNDDQANQDLVNQSVCNMFEKTFNYRDTSNISPPKQIKKNHGGSALKKTQSENVITSKWSSPCASTTADQKLTYAFDNKNCASSIQDSKVIAPDNDIDLSNDEYIIRIGSCSPLPDYENMDMFAIQLELKRFGLKHSLKKRQAIICLEYIYNRTHPYIENDFHLNHNDKSNIDVVCAKPKQSDINDANINFNIGFALDNLVDPNFRNVQVERVFLPSWPRSKKPWCLQPLHIAWHNLIKANLELYENVLNYKPINLHELKIFLKSIDMTFDNKDLISFLDIHCITFRTNKSNKE